MSNKLLVAKSGKNASTDTIPDDFNFHSDYQHLKYLMFDSFTLDWVQNKSGDNVYSKTIVHGLGYIPFFLVFVSEANDGNWRLCPQYGSTISRFHDIHCYVDINNLTMFIHEVEGLTGIAGTNKTAAFKVFIFKNNTGLV